MAKNPGTVGTHTIIWRSPHTKKKDFKKIANENKAWAKLNGPVTTHKATPEELERSTLNPQSIKTPGNR